MRGRRRTRWWRGRWGRTAAETVGVSGGSPGSSGRRPAHGELDGVVERVGRRPPPGPRAASAPARRGHRPAAPASPSASQQAACSPVREKADADRAPRAPARARVRRASRQRAGAARMPTGARARRARRAGYSAEADPVLFVLDQHVDDLLEVQRHRAVLGGRSCQPSCRARRAAGELGRGTRALRTWLPMKPMLIFWGLSSAMSVSSGRLDDLGEHPAGRGGMEEGYPGAADAGARPLVDQPQPGGASASRASRPTRTR